jgi:hypothetical protein
VSKFKYIECQVRLRKVSILICIEFEEKKNVPNCSKITSEEGFPFLVPMFHTDRRVVGTEGMPLKP